MQSKVQVALLRGINVGGKNRIPMAELRNLLESNGFTNVQTYIQSGNVLFGRSGTSRQAQSRIADLIAQHFGLTVPVVVKDEQFFRRVVKQNPFPTAENNRLSAMALEKAPAKGDVNAIKSLDFAPDQFVVDQDVVYVWCPKGSARSKLNINFFEKILKTTATARNWNTIGKLLSMCQDFDG